MKVLIDWLLNSWEHCEDISSDALMLMESLSFDKKNEQNIIQELNQMMEAWIDNEDNIRIEIELNYHKDPEVYNDKIVSFIKKYLKHL